MIAELEVPIAIRLEGVDWPGPVVESLDTSEEAAPWRNGYRAWRPTPWHLFRADAGVHVADQSCRCPPQHVVVSGGLAAYVHADGRGRAEPETPSDAA